MNETWKNIWEDAPPSFEARMRTTLEGLEERPQVRRMHFPRGVLIAAALAVVVLGGTALATNLFGIGSLTVSDPLASPASEGEVIALQGLPDSPEFQANAEWMSYLTGRAQEGTDRWEDETASKKAAIPEPAIYTLYSVDSEESAQELESIVTEYGLRLHTNQWDFFNEDDLYSALNLSPFLTDCSAIVGYVYEDGSFQGDGTTVSGVTYEYQIGRYVKGTFSEVTLNVGSTCDYEEWIYTTENGVDVQLSLGPDRSLLLADLSDAFVAVNLQGGSKGNSLFMPTPLTREDLESFAELIDFTVLA